VSIEPEAKEWLRANSDLYKRQGDAVLALVKKKMEGKYYKHVLIGENPKTYKVVKCEAGDEGAVLFVR
jgi:hypothetical protein